MHESEKAKKRYTKRITCISNKELQKMEMNMRIGIEADESELSTVFKAI